MEKEQAETETETEALINSVGNQALNEKPFKVTIVIDKAKPVDVLRFSNMNVRNEFDVQKVRNKIDFYMEKRSKQSAKSDRTLIIDLQKTTDNQEITSVPPIILKEFTRANKNLKPFTAEGVEPAALAANPRFAHVLRVMRADSLIRLVESTQNGVPMLKTARGRS